MFPSDRAGRARKMEGPGGKEFKENDKSALPAHPLPGSQACPELQFSSSLRGFSSQASSQEGELCASWTLLWCLQRPLVTCFLLLPPHP